MEEKLVIFGACRRRRRLRRRRGHRLQREGGRSAGGRGDGNGGGAAEGMHSGRERNKRGLGIAQARTLEQGEEERRTSRDHSSGFDSIFKDRKQRKQILSL